MNYEEKVEALKAIKEQLASLNEARRALEEDLPELVFYQNADGTWTRFTKTDNLAELINKGKVFRASEITRFTTKLEVLKNKPKEDD